MSELDEFSGYPWNSDQVDGQIVFEALQQTAGRRALLRDRDAFPLFIDAVKAVEPAVAQTVERVAKELDAQTADRMSDVIRRIFGRVLKELADLDNPMRAPGGSEHGEGGVFESEHSSPQMAPTGKGQTGLLPTSASCWRPRTTLCPQKPTTIRQSPTGLVQADFLPSPRIPPLGEAWSRFDPDQGIVFFNDAHGDYLMVKDSEGALLDYLATLVAKEYVVYNNPRASSDEVGEELVRMLVRVRRHIPNRR